jgi:glucose 1-dehydrogenase
MTQDIFSLAGRRALVTGSSRGIGAAIVRTLAAHGASVAVHYAGRADAAEQVAAVCRAAGSPVASSIQADLASPDGADRCIDAALAVLGGIDILVCNASLQEPGPWLDATRDAFARQWSVNVAATDQMLRRCLPAMAERRWGRALTIGSVQEAKPNPLMAAYAATKRAQTALVMALARPYAGQGVTVNNLAPGVIETDRNSDRLADANYRARVLSWIPVGFAGQPADCAGAALLLCSEAGRYITGQSIYVDGGMSLP